MLNTRFKILAAVLLFLALMLWNALDQPNVEDLSAGFEEVALYRNENNTGPVQRIYLVAVEDSIWEQMEQYGRLMPYTKLGNTKVYFFLKDRPFPKEVGPEEPYFDVQYLDYCIGKYERNFQGVSLKKYPFQ